MEDVELICLMLTRDVADRCHIGIRCACSITASSDFWPKELEEVSDSSDTFRRGGKATEMTRRGLVTLLASSRTAERNVPQVTNLKLVFSKH